MRRLVLVCAALTTLALSGCAGLPARSGPARGDGDAPAQAPGEEDAPNAGAIPGDDSGEGFDDGFDDSERADEIGSGQAATIAGILDRIGLRGQIGQHFIVPLKTTQVYARTEKYIRHVLPAGFILYPWNIESREQTVALTKELHRRTRETTGTAPFLAVDQEGGRVQALRLPSLHEHPPARAMGVHADRSYMEAVGYVTAVELQSLGINMNFAPVLDLYGGSDVGVIGDRALAAAPEAVAELGVAYAGGLRRGGVVAVSKHFPGHGATAVDSHGALPRVERTFAELVGSHLKPFAAAAEAGVPAMMTAHIVYPRVEKELPATLSSVWLREILRDRLGFDGLIVTDALEMRAIADNYSLKETLHLGLEAGINVFLITTTIDPIEAAKAVETLVRHGLVSKEQIREGARRVLELKAAYGLLPEPPRR